MATAVLPMTAPVDEENLIMIDVKFADGHCRTLQLPINATVMDALVSIVGSLVLGHSVSQNFLLEWGLAIGQHDKWIDIQWMDTSMLFTEIVEQNDTGCLLFGKKIFTKDDELNILTSAPFLRQILYHQLLQMYCSGMIYCVAHKSTKLSALAAFIHVANTDYLTSGNEWLKRYIPPRFLHMPGILQQVGQHMQSIGQRSVSVVQAAFIKGLMRLETFGFLLYTAIIDSGSGIIGVNNKDIVWMDENTFEPIIRWSLSELAEYFITGLDSITLKFKSEQTIVIHTTCVQQICQQITQSTRLKPNQESFESYTLQTGEQEVDSHDDIEVISVETHFNRHKRKGVIHVSEQLDSDEDKMSEEIVHKRKKESLSPITRNGESRKAFRRHKVQKKRNLHIANNQSNRTRTRLLVNKDIVHVMDSVEELSELMETDFKTETEWTQEDDNPMYDSIASSRVDSTLRKTRVTFSSLSQTLKWKRQSMKRKISVNDDCDETCSGDHQVTNPETTSSTVSKSLSPSPPPLPVKPAHLNTSKITSEVPENVDQMDIDGMESRQRLGTYELETTHPTDNKSRIVLPGEVIKDYATLRREFRMFLVMLPNGIMHWELASLHQPIQKLISRLCVLIHVEDSSKYELFVEGSVLSHLKEKGQYFNETSEDMQTSSSRDFTPSPPQGNKIMNAIDFINSSKSHIILPNQGQETLLLDSNLNFKEHGITTSRILSLRPKLGYSETLNMTPIRVPMWVKFHQSWLAIVHGNQPCTLQDAISLAAILYQCYILDRTEVNSVISFCNVTDFLPLEYLNVKGIEEKILRERESLLIYTRSQLEQIYIEGVCMLPLYNAAFFPCKEPRRHFLTTSKMYPILIGINKDSVMRVDCKSKQILDVWNYEVLRNWGFANQSFMLAFESSTYPVKCNQSKWVAGIISFHVQSIMRSRGMIKEERRSLTSNEEESLATNSHSYFLLDEQQTSETQISEQELSYPVRATHYFMLEKVYDDLLQNRILPEESQTRSHDSVYVNPNPNCSLINPDLETINRMRRLGIIPHTQREHEYDEVAIDDEHILYDEVPQEDYESQDEYCDSPPLTDTSSDDYDDVIYNKNDVTGIERRHNSMTRNRHLRPIISGHYYDLPPDC